MVVPRGLASWSSVVGTSSVAAGAADRDGWLDPQRLLQTSLREIDATMDLERQFTRVRSLLKAKRPDLAICTDTSTGVDIIRKESNRALKQGTYYDVVRVAYR